VGWLTGWDYRKPGTLSRPSGAVTNRRQLVRVFKYYAPLTHEGYDWAISPRNSPSSVVYNGYLYAVFCGKGTTGDGDPHIRKCNLSTGEWSEPVKIATNPAPVDTYNSAPAIIVREDTGKVGKLLVLYGGSETTASKWVESTNAEDITSWGTPADFDTGTALWYSLVQVSNGDIYCFYWDDEQSRRYKKMSSGGSSWSSSTQIVYLNAGSVDNVVPQVPVYDSTNNLIWMTLAYYDATVDQNAEAMYVCAFNPSTGKLRDVAGNEVSLPVSKATFESGSYEFAPFIATGSEETLPQAAIDLDDSQRPQVTYPYYAGTGNWMLKFTRWDGTAWTTPSTVVETGSPANALIWHGASDIDVYVGVGTEYNRYNFNGSSWSKDETLMTISETPYGEVFNLTTRVLNSTPTVRVLFEAQYQSQLDNAWVYAAGEDGVLSCDSGSSVGMRGNVADDFDDLRFTTGDGETLLSYWIDDQEDGHFAFAIVKFDSIGTGPTQFYIYGGNVSASAVSSGADTFIVYDGFERGINGDAIGGDWTVGAGDVKISTAQKYSGTRSGRWLSGSPNGLASIPVTAADNIAIRMRVYKENATVFNIAQGDGTNLLYLQVQSTEDIKWYDGAAYQDTGANLETETWVWLEVRKFVWATPVVDILMDGEEIEEAADISYAAGSLEDVLRIDTSGADLYVDTLIVTDYLEVEPTWGGWEAGEYQTTVLQVVQS